MVGVDARLSSLLGDKTAKPMEAMLGLRTAGDLLRHYPRRYAKRGELTAFNELEVGEHVTLMAKVEKNDSRKIRTDLVKTDVVVTDGQRRLTLTFFSKRGHKAQRELAAGREAFFAGKVELFKGKAQLTNPEYELVDDEQGITIDEFAGALIPIYPATAKVSSLVIQRCVRQVLQVVDFAADPLPLEIREARHLLRLEPALRKIHEPADWGDITRAKDRLKWDEAFVLQVTLAQRRLAARALPGVPRVAKPGGLLELFDRSLPFELTAGQRDVGEVLERELAQSHPMYRLLQGEVGSGKTVVALRAMLAVIDSGGQAALLAPTEVLAQQHHRSLRELLGPLAQAGELGGGDVATRVALLTGSQNAGARRAALAEAASGVAGIVVGTHALLSEGVEFHDLGLVVVDEQHRFGVEQRDALRAKAAKPPHVLVMTATPIPRTVAMTVYGDLEVSTLTELPAGRSPIETHVVGTEKAIERAWQRIREEVAAGRQAFVVCPRIGDSGPDEDSTDAGEERRPAVAVLDVAPMLADGPLRGLRLEVLHGRMQPDAKDDVMRRFSGGAIDVLVATTVIEVGVDVPNATVMVAMDADRFGISQLHQLRGRIGRGMHAGLCLLMTEVEPFSPSGQRLQAVAATTDGFELSRVDLEQRREGDVLGATQSGTRSSLKLLRLLRDEDVIRDARDAAVGVVDGDPELARHPALAQAVKDLVDAERAEYLEKA
ncbi:MAG: ATP-dependent helicase RecG [Actinomycetota bacterium]|nr:ATP-dependent helicase RecG [Actinomycetota bacterium]